MDRIKVEKWQGVTPPLMMETLCDGLPHKTLKMLFTDPIHGDAVNVYHMLDERTELVPRLWEYNMITDRWECHDGDRFGLPLDESVTDELVNRFAAADLEAKNLKQRLKRWREFTNG